jgi:tRNA-splicing ligase RtcB
MTVPIKTWTDGVSFEESARKQVENIAQLTFIGPHIAIMPDVHMGIGATIGSVIPTKGAIIPAAVGVDIGCGMLAVQLSMTGNDLPDNLFEIRSAIEEAVPHGRTQNGGRGDIGAWNDIPEHVGTTWNTSLSDGYKRIVAKHPLSRGNSVGHLGTLGTGNHFIEICLDENSNVWIMLHSGSRGVGGRIGNYFIGQARQQMQKWLINLPDKDLAYLPSGDQLFADYMEAVGWAQTFASLNRHLMLNQILDALAVFFPNEKLANIGTVISCHHNYVSQEHHFGSDYYITRKGAVRARDGELGIIPGSMGAKSYIVRGKGNRDSFQSCSHGAGRVMSRTEAKKKFTLEDHAKATAGVECRKDAEVIDETPGAYKDIDAVMEAQKDLVDIVHTLKQVLCVKG